MLCELNTNGIHGIPTTQEGEKGAGGGFLPILPSDRVYIPLGTCAYMHTEESHPEISNIINLAQFVVSGRDTVYI